MPPVPARRPRSARPYVSLPLTREEAAGVLRALAHGATLVVDEARPAEYAAASREAASYEEVRARLLEAVARRDIGRDDDD